MDRLHPHNGRGYAYVEFSNADEAENAMKHMDGGMLYKLLLQKHNNDLLNDLRMI